MKRYFSLLAILLVCLFFQGSLFAEDAAEKTLVGEYHWNKGHSGDLKAVFTAKGEGTWDVSFYFDFRDKPHTYTGEATGSMDGELSGVVKNESKERTFKFKGSFNEGVFEGDHEETTPSRAGETGTLMLK